MQEPILATYLFNLRIMTYPIIALIVYAMILFSDYLDFKQFGSVDRIQGYFQIGMIAVVFGTGFSGFAAIVAGNAFFLVGGLIYLAVIPKQRKR